MLGGEALRHRQLQQFCWATGEQSSRYSALCSHHNSSIFLKTITLTERTQITEVSGTEATPLHPGTSAGLTGGQGQLGSQQQRVNSPNLSVALSRWETLTTLLLQCLTEGQKSLTELLLLVACCFQLLATCSRTPGTKLTAICVQHFHIWKGCAKEKPTYSHSQSMQPHPMAPNAPKTSPGASLD